MNSIKNFLDLNGNGIFFSKNFITIFTVSLLGKLGLLTTLFALFPEYYLWAQCVPQNKHGMLCLKKIVVDLNGSEMSINKEILKVALLAIVPK